MKTETLSAHLQTALVFGCRYAHNRDTGGAHMMCQAVLGHWDELDDNTQKQILRESHEATKNLDDWEMLRQWAEEKDA